MDGTPYEDLLQEDARWAFGTGFTDPLQGIDTAVPAGVDAEALAEYCLMLGDDALIHSHRLQQWLTRLPELEEETAVANVALDLLGQARLLLARAAAARPELGDDDRLAMFRTVDQMRNVRLVEPPDADFAELVGRLLIVSAWRLAIFERLRSSADPVLAAIAGKGVHEVAYHRDYAARWVVRLGDGTPLSRGRMQAGLATHWPLVEEIFAAPTVIDALPGVAVDPAAVRGEVDAVLAEVLAAAGLDRPTSPPAPGGRHTHHLAGILTELQGVARAHPDATW
jgi:ring-1,2-phenylacetyl-CoA epoxidase subunit PaaC